MLNDAVLRVKMLGEFSMTWNGEELCDGSKSSDAQFTRLLQLLLYRRNEGVERTKLQTLLFDDSNSDDVHHLLRSVIYNARRKLKGTCLPDAQYIEYRGGRYFWTDKIPVRLDAEDFEALCAAADAEQDEDAKLKKCRDAIRAYRGGFLPNQTRLPWVAAEEERLKELFGRQVQVAAAILRERKDYEELEKLGRRASAVCPLNDWEYLILEALVFNGKMREANTLHERTLEQYRKRLGGIAVVEYTEKVEALLGRTEAVYQDIEDVVADLHEGRGSENGAFYCSYPVFYGIYRMLEKEQDFYTATPYLILCSVGQQDNNSFLGDETFEKTTERAKRAILTSVGKDSVICRYGKGQFLIMVLNGSRDICRNLKDRIRKNYKTKRHSENELSFSSLPIGG